MPVREILVELNSYPEPTPGWAIGASAAYAELLGARLSGALWQVHSRKAANFIADALTGANQVIEEENRLSQRNADELRAAFDRMVPDAVRGEIEVFKGAVWGLPDDLMALARLYDLTIVPEYPNGRTQSIAADILFASGRPILLLPPPEGARVALDTIVVGWDGSRAAARALADAMPVLAAARSVHAVTVTGEKPVDLSGTQEPLGAYLERHGIAPVLAEQPAGGRGAGEALVRYCGHVRADLLVMGGFGHSRAREFVLGGATRSILDDPCLPVLMSH